jgi:hypothetical protein
MRQIGEQSTTWRSQWRVERDLEAAVSGPGAILAGPWCSEVGYEVLYWIPFLRWVMAAYRVAPERVVVLSRGGTSTWYRDIAGRYLEVFDFVPPATLSARAANGVLKQREISDFDTAVFERAAKEAGLGSSVRMLHPSLMFRWFAPFWSGHETLGFVERHTRYARVTAPEIEPPVALPDEYAAVKFYSARALPDTPVVAAQLRILLDDLSRRLPVVHLDTGLGIDEHTDLAFGAGSRILSLKGHFDPATNLAVQTRIVADARLFLGTCGSLAWLAPLLGVPTIPLFTDASFLHAHLHVARRVYGRVGGASFSPVDLSGILDAGLAIGSGAALLAKVDG